MELTLTQVINAYLQDEDFRANPNGVNSWFIAPGSNWYSTVTDRLKLIPLLQEPLQAFLAADSDLETLYQNIVNINNPAHDPWWYNILRKELSVLNTHHPRPETEQRLRATLRGINAQNVGERIEQWADYIAQHHQEADIDTKYLMKVGNVPFFISLLAFWIEPDENIAICYPKIRDGLIKLVIRGLFTAPTGMTLTRRLRLITAEEYQSFEAALESLGTQHPELKLPRLDIFWVDAFLYWMIQRFDIVFSYSVDQGNDTVRDDDQVHDDDDIDLDLELSRTSLDDTPLQAVDSALLDRLVTEIRQHILLDESIIHDIYHALLVGHVILTGPPGTGKTHIATMLPKILWQSEVHNKHNLPERTTATAYTTTVVTATDEWNVRTLIAGMHPQTDPNGQIRYHIRPGHLTRAILENWALEFDQPTAWLDPTRVTIIDNNNRSFRGRWLVIDEFNRAPIDVAFGEALTALGASGEALRVPVRDGNAMLPIPRDFRIIGTLNSFDRNYLNQLSEAMKRRFSFIEILPPARTQRAAEQAIVLRKALLDVYHIGAAVTQTDGQVQWQAVLNIVLDQAGMWQVEWLNDSAFRAVFDQVWQLFEVIRLYRQLGTAQAIQFMKHVLVKGLSANTTTIESWSKAFDRALCMALAEQLQVVLPDELQMIIGYLDQTLNLQAWQASYESLSSRRQQAHLQAFSRLGIGFDYDTTAEEFATIFPPHALVLPLFTQRLRGFTQERGI